MIKNIWSNVKFFCGHDHKEPIEMAYQQGPDSLFYACPKYHPENREPEERACSNRLNLVNAEKIINQFANEVEKRGFIGVNLTNYEWDYKTIHIKVLKHSVNEINLEIVDKKALKWRKV